MVLFLYGRHDSKDHIHRVQKLITLIRGRGIECSFDQDVPYENPSGGWASWSAKQIDAAEFVVIIFSEHYARHFGGDPDGTNGYGARWEGVYIQNAFYREPEKAAKKFIPFIFGDLDAGRKFIPAFMSKQRIYTDHPTDQEKLCTRLHEGTPTLNQGFLRDYWRRLEIARYFSPNRVAMLQELASEISSSIESVDKLEQDAILKLCAYETDPGTGIFDLHGAVDLLGQVLEKRREGADRLELSYWHLRESLNLFLFVHSVPRSRFEKLQEIIRNIEELQEASRGKLDEIFAARCDLLLGEALKEEAMITSERERQDTLFAKSRAACHAAIKRISDDKNDFISLWIRGAAHRHLAVTYELEGNEGDTKEHRRDLYKEWRLHSESAATLLAKSGENLVRAYALLNLGQAVSILASFEQNSARRAEELQQGRKHTETALSIFQAQQDSRGEGWAFVHLCENTFKRLERAPEGDEIDIRLEAEKFAASAVNALRRTNDDLGLGLAFKQHGIALFLARHTNERHRSNRVTASMRFLEEAVKHLEQYGFPRWTGEAHYWLAKCHSELWKTNRDTKNIFKSVEVLTKGLILTSAGLRSSTNVEQINEQLLNELEKLLSG